MITFGADVGQAVVGGGRACSIAQKALTLIMILDRDQVTGIQTESADVGPGQYLIGLLRFEELAGAGATQSFSPHAPLWTSATTSLLRPGAG